MLHTSKLRSRDRIGFTGRLKGLAAALLLALLLPVAASAYTVVLRNGRSVDIPADFTVTRAGITYQHAPGLYVTIQMSSIDVAATERANNEAAGALLSRASDRTGRATVAASSAANGLEKQAGRRTLTNKELADVRLRREESEKSYERRRAALGLPSLEETRRQREEETRRLTMQAAQMDSEEAQQESYWRGRAEELRTRIAVINAELRYLNTKLAEERELSLGDVTFVTLGRPLVWPTTGVPGTFPSPFYRRPGHPRTRIPREPFPRRPGTGGGGPRPAFIPVPRRPFPGFWRGQRFGTPLISAPLVISTPYYGSSYDYERSAMNTRVRELEAERAGLQTRWRLLEDEARRAGAPPGWLRP